MRALRELQMEFAEVVFADTERNFGYPIRARGLRGARRLQVYRNNVFAGLTGALGAIYPAIERLVGADYFRYAAHRYIRRHPSHTGNLHDFGAQFPQFLATLPSAQPLAYLPDVARLEWAWHEAFHAADHAPLDAAGLAEVPDTQQPALRFELHPSARLLESSYPVLHIWECNQPEADGDTAVDLAEGRDRLLVLRVQLDVRILRLGAGEFVLLQALAAGERLLPACDAALRAQPDLDVPDCLQRHVLLGTLCGWAL